MTNKNLNLRRPYARQWSRLISTKEGSGSLVDGSTIDITFTGSNYFLPSGKDYSFNRLDMYFSRSETKVVSLSVSNSQKPWIHHASESNINRLTFSPSNGSWVVKKYDPLRLEVSIATTGYCWYKIYCEEI